MFDVDLAEKRTNSKPASDRCDPKGVIAAHEGAGEDAEPISTGSEGMLVALVEAVQNQIKAKRVSKGVRFGPPKEPPSG